MTIEALEGGLTEAEEKFKAEEMVADVDCKSATGLYAQGRGGRAGYRGRGGRGGRGGHGGRGGRAKGTRTQNCTYCRMDNHTTEDCWKRQREQPGWQQQTQSQSRKRARDANNENDVICYHCGETGHMRNECELKKQVNQIRRNRNGNGNGNGNGKGKERALLAIEDKSSSPNQVEEMYENQ